MSQWEGQGTKCEATTEDGLAEGQEVSLMGFNAETPGKELLPHLPVVSRGIAPKPWAEVLY